MKTYKAVFHPEGPLTRIPDAQTVFGALCQAFSQSQGTAKLEEYLTSFDAKPILVHSSMFPDGLFPAPKEALVSLSQINQLIGNAPADVKLALLSQVKQYKKVQYISEGIFRQFVQNDQFEELKRQILMSADPQVIFSPKERVQGIIALQDKSENLSFQTAAAVQTRNSSIVNTVDRELFYQKELFFSKTSNLALYLKTSLSEEELSKILKELEITGIGPRRSIGLNSFRFIGLEEYSVETETKLPDRMKITAQKDRNRNSEGKADSSQRIMLLSDCIPVEGDFYLEKSHYGIESHVYRASWAYARDALTGRFSAFGAGSLMTVRKKKEYYGTVLKTKVKGKPIYHYGIGFVL